MRELVKKVTPAFLKRAARRLLQRRASYFAAASFSQEGEDMVLRRIFEGQPTGFYVDVGAHHPWRFSNTFIFYKLGWRGINIDATAESIAKFHRTRRRDINVEAAVSADARQLTLRIFNDPALNTLQPGQHENLPALFHVVKERTIRTQRLADILSRHLPAQQQIDFLSIDVEGMDLEVLQSNNWSRFRPRYVLCECMGQTAVEVMSSPITALLDSQGYDFFAKTVHTAIFRDRAEGRRGYQGAPHE